MVVKVNSDIRWIYQRYKDNSNDVNNNNSDNDNDNNNKIWYIIIKRMQDTACLLKTPHNTITKR